ncbi:class I SAM-dependent methyltransferase [Streptomyces sp. NPDC005529]|uniref:class I SAM-dependent methyltransferase n=1 Tax=unclassified Streptomyces TaxID=2593676 RepID=UPI0033A3DF17
MVTENTKKEDWQEKNLAVWDERAAIHAASPIYNLAGFRDRFRSGRDVLSDFEIGEVGDVSGKRLLHLQCHIGTSTLSWGRRGALVTGLDFSGVAVETARRLAVDLDCRQVRFVQSSVYEAPMALDDEVFDVVYIGVGSLGWMDDLERWANTVASLVAPGGFLYIKEFHPVALCISSDGTPFGEDYFTRGPLVYQESGTYGDRNAPTLHTRSVKWRHTIGDVVSAVCAAGLRLEFLHEFDFATGISSRWKNLRKVSDAGSGNIWRLPEGLPRAPLTYSLKASLR